jgi:plasmid stabilization system protein ParE
MTPELWPKRQQKPDWRRERALRTAARVVARRPELGDLKSDLLATTPDDVWREPETGARMVLYALKSTTIGTQRYLAFSVAARAPHIDHVGELHLKGTVEGWHATHHALPPRSSETADAPAPLGLLIGARSDASAT